MIIPPEYRIFKARDFEWVYEKMYGEEPLDPSDIITNTKHEHPHDVFSDCEACWAEQEEPF